MLTEGFRNLIQKREASHLLPLLAFSVLLSVLSGYSTFVAISDFTGHAVIATFIAIGVQSLLFLTAWRLGFMLSYKVPSIRSELSVFLVYFSLSTAFSFVGLVNILITGPQQEQARLARVHHSVAETIISAGGKVLERQQKLIHELVSSPEYTAWSGQVAAVADLAAGSKGLLTQVVADSNERRRRQAARLDTDAKEATTNEKALERRLREDTASLQRLDVKRQPLTDEIARLKTKLVETKAAILKLQERMSGVEHDADRTGKPKPGDESDRLTKERQRSIDEQTTIDRLLTQKATRLKTLEAASQTLQARIVRTRGELKATSDRRTAIEGAAAEARRKLESHGTSVGLDLEQIVQALRDAPSAFARTRDKKDFDRADNLCNDLLGNMWNVPALVPKLAGLTCDPGPLLKRLESINEATAALGVLERDCLTEGKNVRTIDALSFDDSLSFARGCLDSASLPIDSIRPERREIERLAQEEGPEAGPFTRAKIALLAGEWQALLALLIAIGLNLLVFISGFIGTRDITTSEETPIDLVLPADPQPDRLYKEVLANARTTHHMIEGEQYDHLIREHDIRGADERKAVRQFLLSNIGQGLVLPHPRESGVYLLRVGLISALLTRLGEFQAGGLESNDAGITPHRTEPPRDAPSDLEPATEAETTTDRAMDSPLPDVVTRTPAGPAPASRNGFGSNAAESAESDQRRTSENSTPFADLDRLLRERD
jgi:hypothetical protein